MKNTIVARLKKLKLFEGCSKEFIDNLSDHAQIMSLPKGNLLFVHDDSADRFYLVMTGWVKLFRETLDGTQAIIDILPSHHIFGEMAMFQDNTYPYSAEAIETATVISFPLTILKNEIETNPHLAMRLMETMANHRKKKDQEIENLTLKNAPQRIGCFLLQLGQHHEEKNISLHLPYDKTLIASRLGMQPETFSRALKTLKTNTNLTVRGNTIEISDIKTLSDYVCASCSSEFPCESLKHIHSKS